MAPSDPKDPKQSSPMQAASEALTASPRPTEAQQPGGGGQDQDAQGRKSLVPQLSIPKGGGAIRGIGEKFDVNPATGTGGMSIPIATTPGRAGFGPGLSLSYDSGAGNGPFGLGWGLSVPGISRKTDKGLPRYRGGAEEDTFVLSGAEDLVPTLEYDSQTSSWEVDERTESILVSENPDVYVDYKVRRYRPRVEGTYARIERWSNTGDTTDVYWKATTPDNVTSTYGKTTSAKLADPANASHVFTWLLEETRDDRGNVIVYQYRAEDMVNVPVIVHEAHRDRTATELPNRYLKRILYGNHDMDTTSTSSDDFYFEVVFDYGEHDTSTPSMNTTWSCRQDPFSMYRGGFEVRTYRLCQRVLMFHRFTELETAAAPRLVRATELSYAANPTLTRLTEVTAKGYADDLTFKSMPALKLTYSDVDLDETVRTLDEQSMENLPAGLATEGCQLVDLNGEGASGVLCEQGGGWTYKPNLGPEWQSDGTAGEARFGAMQKVSEQPARSPMASGYQLMDLGGDGKLDLVQMSGPMAGYSARTPDGEWEPWRPLKSVPNVDRGSAQVHVVDLTGDGLGDLMVGEDLLFRYYPSKGKEGFDAAEWARKASDEDAGPQVLSSAGQEVIAFSDMSGDGLSDIVRIRNREVSYWPNLGYGRFGARVVMSGVVAMDEGFQFDPQRVKLADIDGSGTIDIIYLHAGGPKLYLNQSGNSFGTPEQLTSLAVGDRHRQVQVADILGRGTAQLVWSSPLAADAHSPLRYIDLMAAGKPHLLTEVDNNLGATTRVRYVPSTRFYLEDKAAGDPWITRMAFPVHVVQQVETWDAVSKNWFASSYRYRHGYFDGHEREFRGFAYVEQRDSAAIGISTMLEEGASPSNWTPEFNLSPVVTKSWYHTGAWLDRQDISTALAAEYYSPTWTVPKLADTVLPLPTELPAGVQSLSIAERREACRALKGQMLHQEVYAEDESTDEGKPYSVTESNAQLRVLQPQSGQKHAVFAVAAGEALSMHFERDESDPRVTHELALEVDDFGNVLKSAQVAYPRRGSGPTATFDSEQQKLWILVTEQDVFNSPTDATIAPAHTTQYDPTDWYRVGVPVETKTYELTLSSNPDTYTPDNLLSASVLDAFITGASEINYETAPTAGSTQKRLVEHVRQIYTDNSQNDPLDLGEVESKALPWRSYSKAFTSGLLTSAYGTRVTSTMLGTDGGYVDNIEAAGNLSGTTDDGSYWLQSERQTFAGTGFYQPVSVIDPFGNTTSITYDCPSGTTYYLAPIDVTDPVGNTVTAVMDYQVMAPKQVTDENDNVTSVKFDVLGMVVATAQQGKGGEGDTLTNPTTMLSYEWALNGEPAYVYTKAREQHGGSPTWLETYSYSDGLGREVSRKVLAEDGDAHYVDSNGLQIETNAHPRWVGTGRTVFDNKGNPIKQYEPFFSTTSAYEKEEELTQWGVTPILRYDPLGRLIRTDLPNGTYSKVVFDAWEQQSWDENDTVVTWNSARTSIDEETDWYAEHSNASASAADQRAATLAAAHAGTPTVTCLDTLGRPYLTQQDKGNSSSHDYVDTRVTLDIEGLQRSVTDSLSRMALTTEFDMVGNPIHTDSIDAGERWLLTDVMGQEVYAWDSRSHKFTTTYDELRRPLERKVNDGTEETFEKFQYGEGATSNTANDKVNNLHGRIFKLWDGAGLVENSQYDFKGNLLSTSRTLVAGTGQYTETEKVPDWSVSPTLDSVTYTTVRTYDALNRVVTERVPDDPATAANCTVIRNTYNEAGLLDQVDAQVRGEMTAPPVPDPSEPVWTPIVTNIDYNPRGQREKIAYGCGASPGDVTTTYTYDDDTFRLTEIKTVKGASTDLQEIDYTYDPVGNIVQIEDKAQAVVFTNNSTVEPKNEYTYDALYRLIAASGREHPGQTTAPPNHSDWTPLEGFPDPRDPESIQRYKEEYTYDSVGNITQIRHKAYNNTPWNWTRDYTYDTLSNKLQSIGSGTTYSHDAHGNMTHMPHLVAGSFEWNHQDQLQKATVATANPVYYQYDAAGQRVRKQQRNTSNPTKERIYLGNFEIYWEYSSGSTHNERQTVHITDGDRRVCMLETKTLDEGSTVSSPTTYHRYQFDNHLGTACVELDKNGAIISYEEYHPYGTTAYHAVGSNLSVSAKRYRYTGKERDEETGLYYHGARYYAAWLGRWTAADPAGMVDGVCLFCYVRNSPVGYLDRSGNRAEPPVFKTNSLPNIPRLQKVKLKPEQRFHFHPKQRAKLVRHKSHLKGHALFEFDPKAERNFEEAWKYAESFKVKEGEKESPTTELGFNPQGSQEGVKGSKGGALGGIKATMMDWIAKVESLLTLSGPGSEDGKSGGLAGGNEKNKEGNPLVQGALLALKIVAHALLFLGASLFSNASKGGLARLGRKGRVQFEGLEVRGVRDLSHVDDSTLRAMRDKGFAAKDHKGRSLMLHHHQQNPAGFIVEIPASKHSIGNPRQHPFGNTKGAGLSADQRAAFDSWRVNYWKARAGEELGRRGL